jgi:uncharacterized membrane protein
VLLITLVGVVIRIVVAHQSFFADELATYWIITTRGLGSLISALYSTHDEITPPLYFVASWFTAHISHAPELIRAPSLVAGALMIPAVYLLGVCTVGRRAALLATVLTALSPFMIYYSTEARAYAVMMLLLTVSTLSMLRAIDTGRRRWWVLYALCSCGAFYAHYTCAFYLAAQFGWLLLAHPAARRPALLANLGAVIGVLPWLPAVINAANSPTTKIMSALSPFTPHAVRIYLEHWAIGYPYPAGGPLTQLPGRLALVLLALAGIVALAPLAARAYRDRRTTSLPRLDQRVVLVIVLLVSVLLGEAIVSALSTHIFGVRNLASAWPPLTLAAGALLVASGPRLSLAAAALAILSFALGAAKMLSTRWQRPDYRASADFVARNARVGDVVIDETGVLSPGPLTGFDVAFHRRLRVFRAGVPQERDHPFAFSDTIVPLSGAIHDAVAAAGGGGRIFVVEMVARGTPGDIGISSSGSSRTAALHGGFPPAYRPIERRVEPGFVGTSVTVYANRAASRG